MNLSNHLHTAANNQLPSPCSDSSVFKLSASGLFSPKTISFIFNFFGGGGVECLDIKNHLLWISSGLDNEVCSLWKMLIYLLVCLLVHSFVRSSYLF